MKDKLKTLTRERNEQKTCIKDLHKQLRFHMQAMEDRAAEEADKAEDRAEDSSAEPPQVQEMLNFKGQRFFKEAAEQHVKHVQERQNKAVRLFEELGVDLKEMAQLEVFAFWANEVKKRTEALHNLEEKLKATLGQRDEFKIATRALLSHWLWLSRSSLLNIMTTWKEAVSNLWQRKKSPFTSTTPSQHLANSHYLNEVHSVVTACAENQLPAVYERVLASAMDLTDAETAVLFLVDALSGSLSPVGVSAHGQNLKKSEERIQVFPDDPCVLGLVAKDRCIYLCSGKHKPMLRS